MVLLDFVLVLISKLYYLSFLVDMRTKIPQNFENILESMQYLFQIFVIF